MDKDKELEEAGEFVKELYEFTYLDEMIKDFKEKDERDDEEFLSWLIWFRGQVLDFIEKYAKKDEPEKAQDKEGETESIPYILYLRLMGRYSCTLKTRS